MKADAASGYQTKISTDTDSQSQSSRELKMSGFPCNPGMQNRWEKTRIRNLQYGPKNEANKMFIIWLLPFWGPETRRAMDLTVI